MPGGSCMPPITLCIFSCVTRSTFCTASLMAAAIRSSSMSLSSLLTIEGSSDTRRTSCLPVIVTFAMPPPDSPVTSRDAISACARCRFACICCACFIMLPMLPFIEAPRSFGGADRIGRERGAEHVAHRTHVGVVLDRSARLLHAIVRGSLLLTGQRIQCAICDRKLQSHWLAKVSAQCLRQLFFELRSPKVLAVCVEYELYLVALSAGQRGVGGKLFHHALQVHLRDHRRPIVCSRGGGCSGLRRRSGRLRKRSGGGLHWGRGSGHQKVRTLGHAEREHAQEHHLESTAHIGREFEIATAYDRDLIEQ